MISEVEVFVMEVLWCGVLCSVEEIFVEVGVVQQWQEGMVKFLFNWFFKKKVVKVECDGCCYFYSLLLLCEKYVYQISKSLFDCLFGGCVVLLVVYFFEQQKFLKKDIVELCQLFKEFGDEYF